MSSASIRDIADQPLIANKEGDFSAQILIALSNSGIRLRPRFIFNSDITIQHYIKEDMGYGILPYVAHMSSIPIPEGTTLVPLKERVNLYQVLLISPLVQNTSLAKTILSAIRKWNLKVDRLS